MAALSSASGTGRYPVAQGQRDRRSPSGSASGNELAANSATACLGKLLAEGFAQSGRCSAKAMAALAAMVEHASTLRLHYTEAEQGARQLETLVGR